MAVRIKFDGEHNVIQPTLVLSTRAGKKIGTLPATAIVYSGNMIDGDQMTFIVDKADCVYSDGSTMPIWDKLVDFKLVYANDWDKWFEIYVNIDESDGTRKNISAMALGEAELSQVNLYGVEINSEDDISRDDYVPAVLYNEDDQKNSILGRVFSVAPHYRIAHVDSSIAGMQRVFSFDSQSVLESIREIEGEISCLFVFDCHADENGGIARDVYVYDLESVCLDCGTRGDFTSLCSECGSTNIVTGYGKDTAIFISRDNIAEQIQHSTDHDSVKNCFKMIAGDELMTATVAACNPNGTPYIWNISDDTKEDMTGELRSKLAEYDSLYAYYQNEYNASIQSGFIERYNEIARRYSTKRRPFPSLPSSIVGYPAIMEAYFDTIDLSSYLKNEMTPDVVIRNTIASMEVSNLVNYMNYSTVAVKDIRQLSLSTADSAVLSVAKIAVDNRYKIKITSSSLSGNTWSGKISVTNYADEEDTAESPVFSCAITDDYEAYLKQSIAKSLNKSMAVSNTTDYVSLFSADEHVFKTAIESYSLSGLEYLRDACQSCIDILIQNGAAEDDGSDDENNPYVSVYTPYYNRLTYINEEITKRESDIFAISGEKSADGSTVKDGIQDILLSERSKIMRALNFEDYVGKNLMLELASYRRDDVYENSNYISDGLRNAEIFKLANQFLEVASKEIRKASHEQHTISTSLSNLLAIPEFEPIISNFEIGNWIRVRADGSVYRMRLVSYQVSFDNIDTISVTFSTLSLTGDQYSDLESVISNASSIASSYDYVTRQAKKGSDTTGVINNWIENGLSMTQMKIVNSAESQDVSFDEHGILCREYIPEFGKYDDRQLKIINRGLYVTDDSWRTSSAGIGDFIVYNPKTKQFEEHYGVIADTLVGNLILTKEVGVYNESGNVSIDENGITITSDMSDTDEVRSTLTIQRKRVDGDGDEQTDVLLGMDSDGNLTLDGSFVVASTNSSFTDIVNSMRADISVINGTFTSRVEGAINGSQRISELTQDADDLKVMIANVSNQIKENFDFTDHGLVISRDSNESSVVIDEDSVDINIADSTIATLGRDGLSAATANITKIVMGDYTVEYNGMNGHLTVS